MDWKRAAVTAIHILLASTVAILAVIGLFGTGGQGGEGGTVVAGGFGLAFFIILPIAGIVALGLFDWQIGRGPGTLRAADVAAFSLASLELSLGTIGLVRWLVGLIALLAASGLAATLLVVAPRRAGFRH
jgi:hypothetical protein